MSDAKVTLANIADRVPNTYNTNERWVVKKMKLEYANIIVIILPIIYQKDKVQYFSNKSTMMISRLDHGKFVNWVIIMYSQLVKELIKWEKCQKNLIGGIAKKRTEKGCMPFYHSVRNSILKVVSTRRNRITGEKETCKATTKRIREERRV